MIRSLDYENPQIALFLRRLAWEQHIAEKPISVKDAVDYVQGCRLELGLRKYQDRSTSGGADDFIQKRFKEIQHWRDSASPSLRDLLEALESAEEECPMDYRFPNERD